MEIRCQKILYAEGKEVTLETDDKKQTPRKLPRLLEEGRVEVRLASGTGTYVFEEPGIDDLLSHLAEAKRLLHPETAEPAVDALRLRELALDISNANGVLRVLMYRGHDYQETERDYHNAVRAFDAALQVFTSGHRS